MVTDALGFGPQNISELAPAPADNWKASEERLKREESSTAGDYAGSIMRQEWLLDGLIATHVGNQMTPQPGYFAGSDEKAWKELTTGIWPEFQDELYQASSPAHASFLRDRLLDKQKDLQRLGDMGWVGNTARFAMGAADPAAILMGVAGGWVAKGAKAASVSRAMGVARTAGIEEAKLNAAAQAARAALDARAPAVAAGVTFGAAENAAYEYFRQGVNFEDDSLGVLEAGLFGAAFTASFAVAGARASRRVADAAEHELAVLESLQKASRGEELTAADVETVRGLVQQHKTLTDLEAGRISSEDFDAIQRGDFVGPVEPPEAFLKRLGDQFSADAQKIIDDLFPGSKGDLEAPPKAPPSPMPKSIAEEMADHKARLDAIEEQNRRNATAGEAARPKPETGAVANPEPAEMPTLGQVNAANPKLDGPGQGDLRALLRKGEEKAERDSVWDKLEADQAAAKAKQESDIQNAPDVAAAQEVQDAMQAARQWSKPDAKTAAAPEVDTSPQRWVGQEVSFDGGEGKVIGVSPSGKLIIDTGNGPKGYVNKFQHELDQWDGLGVPEGFQVQSVGSGQVLPLSNIAEQATAFSKARLDYFAILNRSQSPAVRRLVFRLVKDAIQVDREQAQGWTASEHKKHLQRTVGGRFHREAEAAYMEAVKLAKVPMLQRSQFKHDFYAAVSRAVRNPDSLQGNPLAGPIGKAAGAMKEAYAKLLGEAQKAGVKGAQGVQPNDAYVNRVWNHDAIRDLEAKHGHLAVAELVANAIRVPGLTGDIAKARRFLDAIARLQFNQGARDVHLQGRDMGTLRSELQAHGLTSQEIDALVDTMFEAKTAAGSDAGNVGQLKFRFDLDESMYLDTPQGRIQLVDLLEQDARVLMDTYANSMGGQIGLARNGIDSQATWQAELRKIEEEALSLTGIDPSRIAEDIKHLSDLHAHIVGRPMSTADFSKTARLAAAARGYTRGVVLGQLGLTAAIEMQRIAVLFGFGQMLRAMPSFGNFFKALRLGFVPEKGLAEDIMNMSGFGTEMAASYARRAELESGYVGGTLSRIEASANKVSHISDIISGNASFTSLTRQVAGMAAARQAWKIAQRGGKISAKLEQRWVGQGLDAAEIPAVLGDLKTYSSGKSGVLDSIDYERWAREEPDTYSKFQLFLSRQVRDAIQDHDIGETMPWMHSTLGKILGELKTFMLVGHAKNFLKNAHHRDLTTLQGFMIGFVAESMAYAMQTAINFPGELDERLAPEKIASAVFFRMQALGLTSLLVETGYNIATGGDSLVSPGMTANTDNRSLLKTPTVMTINRLTSLPMNVGGTLFGSDVLTSGEARDSARALPGSRLYGMPALINYLSEMLPKVDPEKAYQP